MGRNVNTGRVGRARVTGPIDEKSDKSDVTTGKSVSNTHKKTGLTDKGVKKFAKVETPIFTPGGGDVPQSFDAVLTNPQAYTTYKYTIDGSSPTGVSAQTLVSDQITGLALTGSPAYLNLKLYGYRNDYANSDIMNYEYSLQPVQDVVVYPPSGNAPNNQLISLSIEQGATGFYTLDGTTPSGGLSTSSLLYAGPFIINFGSTGTMTVKAMAEKGSYADSTVVSGVFTHDATLDYSGPHNGIRDVNGKIVTYSPSGDRVPFPSRVFLSTTAGTPISRKTSFWGTDYYVQNNKPTVKDNFIALSAGQNHALALTKTGTVFAWGDNASNQVTLTDSLLTTSGKITHVEAGDLHSLALTNDNQVIAWGDNSQGQINVPTNLSAIRAAAGGEHSLALKADRTLVGWGNNDNNQIDFPSNLNDVIEISAGENHSVALVGYGTKTCKQLNYVSGDWKVINKLVPVGKATAWGINDMTQTSVPSGLSNNESNLIAIACGGNHTLTLDTFGKVSGWGDTGHNQLVIPSFEEFDGVEAYIVKISAGFSHSLALSDRGTVFAWGSNQNNQTNITNLLSNSALIAGGDNYSLAFGLEPDEHIYYNTGNANPSILYTGVLTATGDTTFKAISVNKTSQAASNVSEHSYAQQKLNAVESFGQVASRGAESPLQTGSLNPATFTPKRPFAIRLVNQDVPKDPDVRSTVSHPGYYTNFSTETLSRDDATAKRFSSALTVGDVDKPFDGDKSIDNYAEFNPGGYVGYKFRAGKRITKVDFATNADNFHKVGAGIIQGSNDGITWHDITFFSNKFPDSYPPFVSLDGQALDRIASIEMISGGSGYTEEPLIVFNVATNQEGEGAKAKALFSPFALTGFSVLTGGTGYTTTPTIDVVPSIGGSGASGTAVLSDGSIIHEISLIDSGNGYTSTPVVTVLEGEVSGVSMVSSGLGYTGVPTVSFVGGYPVENGVTYSHIGPNPDNLRTGVKVAQGYALTGSALGNTGVTGIVITDRGQGYTSVPTVQFTSAQGLYGGEITGVNLTNFGIGYTGVPTVIISGGREAGVGHLASGTALTGVTAGGTGVTGVTLTNSGAGYYNLPAVTFSGNYIAEVIDINVTANGAGYTGVPTVIISGGREAGVGHLASGTAFTGNTDGHIGVTGVNITNAGAGYYNLPTVTFSGNIDPTGISGLGVALITTGASGAALLTAASHAAGDAVMLPSGEGATAVAYLTPTTITGIEILENKVPYRTSPAVGFDGGGGNGAVAIAHLTAFTIGQMNREGRLIGIYDYKAPYGYHLYDGVDVPGVGGVPTNGNFGGGGGYGGGDSSLVPTGLFKLDHFDLTNLGTGYTAAPSVGLAGGTITKSDCPYAVISTICKRGPTSGDQITESAGFEITNKNYLNGTYYSTVHAPQGVSEIWHGNGVILPAQYAWHTHWGSDFKTALGTSWQNESPATHPGNHGKGASPKHYFFTDRCGPHRGSVEPLDTDHSIDTRQYHLRFHKNSSLTQNIMITGGGGVGMTGYMELRNHNELLGFDDSDTLLDKLIAINTDDTYRAGSAPSASDYNNITYEELLWSTPASKGGKLPDADGTLIPYKLHITEAGTGYTGAPTITEEFDRSYPGMMYLLESGGITTTHGGENDASFYELAAGWYGQYTYDHYDLLWGQDPQATTCAGATVGPCKDSLTGYQTTESTNNGNVTGHYLQNKYLNGNDFVLWYPTGSNLAYGNTAYQCGATLNLSYMLKLWAPKTNASFNTNDMYDASSVERLNFENKLVELVDLEAIMPKHSTLSAFLQSGDLDRIEMTNIGSGYGVAHPGFGSNMAPLIQISGGTLGTDATGIAHLSKSVASITLTASGENYQSFPDVNIVGGGGDKAFAVGKRGPQDVLDMTLISGGKNYTESPVINVAGGGTGVTSLASAKCRLPVALSSLAFTNNNYYKHYRLVGQGDNVLKTSQLNELEFYSGDNRIAKYSSRNNHALAIKSNGDLVKWGDNSYYQLESSGVVNALDVSAGERNSLVLKDNGTVIAIGNNDYGQNNIPNDLNNVISVSAGDNHGLALLAGGIVKAWGRNHSGQCNVPSSLSAYQSGNNGAISVAAGNNHSLALRGDGTVLAWGSATPSSVPSSLDNITEIAAGEKFSLALKDNGDVVSWGGGNGALIPTGLKDVVSISACNDHALVLQVDGTVTGWGQISGGETVYNFSETIPQNLNSGIAVYAGKNHGTILREDGSMLVFGLICSTGTENYFDEIVPSEFVPRHCCGTTGMVTFDLGQVNNNKLNTNENLAYRSADISPKTSLDAAFPPTGSNQNKVRVVSQVTGYGYVDSDLITGDYDMIELEPIVSPETNSNYGPSITVSNWSQDSVDSLTVRYTTDGTSPATGSSYSYVVLPPDSGDFIHALSTGEFNNSTMLKVYAFSDVYLNSDIVSYQRLQLSAPTVNITPTGSMLQITMSTITPPNETRDPNVYYSLDGSTPTTGSYLYSDPINLQATSVTVKAISSLIGYIASSMTTEIHP